MGKLLYREEQRCGRTRMLKALGITVIIGVVLQGYWFVRLFYSGKIVTSAFFLDSGFIVITTLFFIALTIVVILNSISRLRTKIKKDFIYVNYYPYKRKWEKIGVSGILSYKIRKYSPYREYSGYGVRDSQRKGKAYIISGNTGLQLYLKDGERILIGTQKIQAIRHAMDKVMKEKNSLK